MYAHQHYVSFRVLIQQLASIRWFILILPPPVKQNTTDIDIQHSDYSSVELPETSTMVVGVNEIMPDAEEHG